MGKYRTSTKNGTVGLSDVPFDPKVAKSSCDPSLEPNGLNKVGKGWKGLLVDKRRQKRHISLALYTLALGGLYFYSSVYHVQASVPFVTYDGISSRVYKGQDPLPGSDLREGQDGVKNCSLPSSDQFPGDLFTKEERLKGALVVHFAVSIYVFYALLLVCDEYFVPAVESICRELNIPSDVAGATFMAISTSAPELFANIMGTFVTNGDMGVGTIVGSAVFNLLAVGACCGLGAGYAVKKIANSDEKIGVRLEWWPLTRDSIFYMISIGALIGVILNRKVYWYEALILILIYGFYVLVLCYNSQLKGWTDGTVRKVLLMFSIESAQRPRRLSVVVGKVVDMNERTPLLIRVKEKGGDLLGNLTFKNSEMSERDLYISQEYDIPANSLDQVLIYNALDRSNLTHHRSDREMSYFAGLYKPPSIMETGWRDLVEWILSWPIRLVLTISIPNCKVHRFRKWYWSSLIMCVAWIGVFSYVASWMVSTIGETLSIPESVTGLTFLAAGTSIPEVISSLIVARQGLGAMAFSNTIGSNIFDILICLGLPWLIKASLGDKFIEIQSGGMEYSAVLLVTALLLLYFLLALNRFVLDRKIGLLCILMYIIFISLACMIEMNVFFPVNLPPCPSTLS